MENLNYHHLRYFWVTAREGSLRRASEVLRISQPSMSAQIKLLEDSLGQKLFKRDGRGLALTDAGSKAFAIANEIFTMGSQLAGSLSGESVARVPRLSVGITDVLPKTVAHSLLEPALRDPAPWQLQVREGLMEDLLGILRAGRLDMVLANEPAPSGSGFLVFNHFLGECGTAFMADAKTASRLKRGFPLSLHGQKALLPTAHTPGRKNLDQWFRDHGIEPIMAAEFDDPALMKVFAADGCGFIPVPEVVVGNTILRHGLQVFGRTDDLRESFYAITPGKEFSHTGVQKVIQEAAITLSKEKPRRQKVRS